MKYPIDMELFSSLFRAMPGDRPGYEAVCRMFCLRVNGAYEDGKQGADGYPVDAVTELRGLQQGGMLPEQDKWPVSKLTQLLAQMCNEAYEQGRNDAEARKEH